MTFRRPLEEPAHALLVDAFIDLIESRGLLVGGLGGRLPLDTNAVENAIRPIALGRRNWMFAGSEAGGRRAAQIYSLIGSAKLNGIEPLAYLTDILQRLPTARQKDLDALLPWNWAPATPSIDITAELARPPEPLVLVPI